MRFHIALAALAATTAFAAPAAAAPSNSKAEVNSRAVIVQPATIVGVTDLDFGIVSAGTTAGTVTLTPGTTLAVSNTGGASPLGGAVAGRFDGNGLPDQAVVVTVSSTPTLNHQNGVDKMTFTSNAYGAGPITIAKDGLFRVLVGGTISVGALQEPGMYEGKVFVDAAFQ